jgi:hypothetical protein
VLDLHSTRAEGRASHCACSEQLLTRARARASPRVCAEKNKPATFKYPLFSLRGDFQMWFDIVAGKRQLRPKKRTA